MKNHLIIAAALLFAAKFTNAQTEKGTENLGLNFSVQHSSLSGTTPDNSSSSFDLQSSKYTDLGLGANYSYFIADKLDIAADLSYSHGYNYTASDVDVEKEITNGYDAELSLRKYFMCSAKFGFRAGPYVGYNKGNTTNDYGPNLTYFSDVTHSTDHSFDGGLRLEMVYYPAKRLGLSAMLVNAAYSHGKANDSDSGKDTSNGYALDLLTNVTDVSLFYVFGGK